MKLIDDDAIYDKHQTVFIQAIAQVIKSEIEQRNIDAELAKDLTADLTFSVASILDGSRQIEIEDSIIEPILTFKADDDNLLYPDGGSWMHENVYGWVYDLFNK